MRVMGALSLLNDFRAVSKRRETGHFCFGTRLRRSRTLNTSLPGVMATIDGDAETLTIDESAVM
jgi:hypothetical protein